jgi:hypothetical protein
MIVNEIFHGVQCDRCGEIHDGGDYSFYSDEQSALDSAIDDEWIEEKGKHYCPNCYEFDEETDEPVPYPPYPDEVKKVCDFISYVLKACPEVHENTEGFIVVFNEYSYKQAYRSKLDDAAKNWIKAIVPEVVFDKEVIYDRQTKHFITIITQ